MPCIGSRKAEPRLEICNRNLRRWTDDDLILCILTAGGQRHDDVDVYLHGGTDPVSVAQTRFRLFNVRRCCATRKAVAGSHQMERPIRHMADWTRPVRVE